MNIIKDEIIQISEKSNYEVNYIRVDQNELNDLDLLVYRISQII